MKQLVALLLLSILAVGCINYTIDDFAKDVQKTISPPKVKATPKPTAVPTIAATPSPTPLPTPTPAPYFETPDDAVATNEVIIRYSTFNPHAIKVKQGTKVIWKNQDGRLHSVKSKLTGEWAFDSFNIAGGQEWSHIFDSVGVYEYYDGVGTADFGTVYVEAN